MTTWNIRVNENYSLHRPGTTWETDLGDLSKKNFKGRHCGFNEKLSKIMVIIQAVVFIFLMPISALKHDRFRWKILIIYIILVTPYREGVGSKKFSPLHKLPYPTWHKSPFRTQHWSSLSSQQSNNWPEYSNLWHSIITHWSVKTTLKL